MKNVKNFLSLFVALIFVQGLFAQNEIAMVASPVISKSAKTTSEKAIVVDQKGITEISQFLADQVEYPFAEIAYANELNVRVQISLNEKGMIIDKRIVETSSEKLGDEILATLDKAGLVSPILINGKAKTQTLQIPLKFKR